MKRSRYSDVQVAYALRQAITLWLLAGSAFAADSYSPYAETSYPENVYWGDTHLHTNLSVDTYPFGNRRLGPDDAYRFARGEVVTAENGMKVRLHRPLDFLVISDHSEYLGVLNGLDARDPAWVAAFENKPWFPAFEAMKAAVDPDRIQKLALHLWVGIANEFASKTVRNDASLLQPLWRTLTLKSDEYNTPGKFTTFIGFEWSSQGQEPFIGNLHRVVVFRDGADKASRALPLSSQESNNPEDLWKYLSAYQAETGGDVIAIPHNGNLSNGGMFQLKDFDGSPLSRTYAEVRSYWEPLFEVTQMKGDSETHPLLSPTDEFAEYERWNGWAGRQVPPSAPADAAERKIFEYARSGLKLGLQEQARLGVNPFKFGMIGGTDSHTSLSTAEEDNFWGKMPIFAPSPKRLINAGAKQKSGIWDIYAGEYSAAGYAAVWATSNTRPALFAAMRRKETYASTGPRMEIRFFGGWDYAASDARQPDLARIGYAKGVPMGGDLTRAPPGKAPRFLIRAVKDPDGANLDRLQVIKGWRDTSGKLHEKVFNVALSDGRKETKLGGAPPVGNTVNVKDASYANSIGAPELASVWSDPEFQNDELAYYYLRVLQIPTPRWNAYDAKYFGIANPPQDVEAVTQERAYTSPIWYTP